MFFSDGNLETAQRGVAWSPDLDVLEERRAMAVRRRTELETHNVPLDPPCDTCPAKQCCNMECSAFQKYLNAPLSKRKRLL